MKRPRMLLIQKDNMQKKSQTSEIFMISVKRNRQTPILLHFAWDLLYEGPLTRSLRVDQNEYINILGTCERKEHRQSAGAYR